MYKKKILVLYVFHIYNDRVKHFINNCIFESDNIDFVLISNNKENVFEYPSYVKVLVRNNIGYDFGGWSDALLLNDLYKNYEYFLFINSSVMGPFGINKDKWVDVYINGLTDNIKLFGSTINTIQDPLNKSHVQSYIFSMNKDTLQYLINCDIFSMTNYANTFSDAIHLKEILMSQLIIKNNWNIGSLLKCYKNVDFTFKNKNPNDYNLIFHDDIMMQHYMNNLWTLDEVIFIKGNRISL